MTEEEKKARTEQRKKSHLEAIMAPRAGTRPAGDRSNLPPSLPAITKGLELSEVVRKPLAWFKEDPENAADFQALKDKRPQYWQDLKRDIEAAGILTPLLATEDGTLLQGHSRLTIAREIGLVRVPVQIIESGLPLDPEERVKEIRKRRRLDNLLRFEIDENHRLAMLAQIWPDFYTVPGKKGRPEKQDTVSHLSEAPGEGEIGHGVPYISTAAQIAEATGKSEKQVNRDRALVSKATEQARKEGHQSPTPAHIAQVREAENQERRTKATKQREIGHGVPFNFPNIAETGITLAGWINKSGPGYMTGVQQCLIALATYQIIPKEIEEAIVAAIEKAMENKK